MTEKRKHKHEEESEMEKNEAVADSTPQETVDVKKENPFSGEVESLTSQLREAEKKAAEYKDGWARAQADFQNYKKRLERDNELTYITMKGDIIKKVLPALDDLERALQNRPADNGWANGIELIARKLQNVLESEGIKRIEAEGVEFDPNYHEAISHEPADGVKSGFVIGVVQNGYMLGERVIRPAMVRVAQ
jgi:molecular chaperone GrpE